MKIGMYNMWEDEWNGKTKYLYSINGMSNVYICDTEEERSELINLHWKNTVNRLFTRCYRYENKADDVDMSDWVRDKYENYANGIYRALEVLNLDDDYDLYKADRLIEEVE